MAPKAYSGMKSPRFASLHFGTKSPKKLEKPKAFHDSKLFQPKAEKLATKWHDFSALPKKSCLTASFLNRRFKSLKQRSCERISGQAGKSSRFVPLHLKLFQPKVKKSQTKVQFSALALALVLFVSFAYFAFGLPTITFQPPTLSDNSTTGSDWVFVNLDDIRSDDVITSKK